METLHHHDTWEKKGHGAEGANPLAELEGEGSDSDQEGDNVTRLRERFVVSSIKQARSEGRRSDWTQEKHEAVGEVRRQVIREFLTVVSGKFPCKSCQGLSPAYRKDRFVKIFRKALTEKEKAAMSMAGKVLREPMVVLQERRRAREAAKKSAQKLPNGHFDEGVADLDSPEEDDGDDVNMGDTDDEGGGVTAAEVVSATNEKEAVEVYINAGQVHAALTLLFEQEGEVLNLIYGSRDHAGKRRRPSPEIFFVKNLLVPPSKYRPEAKTSGDAIAESPDNKLYQSILNQNTTISEITREMRKVGDPMTGRRRRNNADLQNTWIQLQDAVNTLIDRERNPARGAAALNIPDGIKQKLEKKEGLFRKNMMGKRVNFAARSVISPDPNIETNEIGVPPVFAKKLTYPEPVASHNYYDLHQAVINGPDVWPGAAAIENENGQVVNLRSKNQEERIALANQLMAPSNVSVNGAKPKKVHRHLNNGDIVIMNRQPTLHKPSMMCHKARVLPAERTIRMHYANCNTYNADFDGDEMNMHFPQNELARAEAISIADTDHQYLSATAGKPLRGLIQDHISMAVQLTKRDTFFNKEDYYQLLYASLRPENNHTFGGERITVVKPAILKPVPRWTGKQLITTILINISPEATHGRLNMTGSSQTNKKLWSIDSEEQDVLIRDSNLLIGIMDKGQIGPTKGGLVHAVYETYGHVYAGKLLSVLGRLLTKMLHMRAFSCGVEDLILTPKGEVDRVETLKAANTAGLDAASTYVLVKKDGKVPSSSDPELLLRLEDVLRDDNKQETLDGVMKGAGQQISSAVTAACLPVGLVKPFPKNQMQAMTNTGAKGSMVNANLISCNLGQQVLEGRRVPTMISGKTLPCFKPFESSLRAGGYIVDRFLTGVRPQEYFFHAMAGREGLIDTAVKTSRSGYLQRCLIKGMEGLRVEYDTSVRDSDGSVIQFLYGEDGLDITKATYLNQCQFKADNFWSQSAGVLGEGWERISDQEEPIAAHMKSVAKALNKGKPRSKIPDPVLSIWNPGRYAASVSETFYNDVKKFSGTHDDFRRTSKKDKEAWKQKLATIDSHARQAEEAREKDRVTKKDFEAMMWSKYLKSVVDPGEAVGVVAGQSVGEPSTQMTLNTFHLAGHSAKNVTLGIPRLREIVMTASANIATPTMTLHVNEEISKDEAAKFAKGISRLSISEIVDKVTVKEKTGRGIGIQQAKMYNVRIHCFPSEEYAKEYAITVRDVLNAVERKLLPLLTKTINAEMKKKGDAQLLKTASKQDAVFEIGNSSGRVQQDRGDGIGGLEGGRDDEEADGDDGDATNTKDKRNRSENASYETRDEDDDAALRAENIEEDEDGAEDDDASAHPKAQDSDADAADRENADEEVGDPDSIKERRRRILKAEAERVEQRIKNANKNLSSFTYDYVSGNWIDFAYEFPAATSKVLMLTLVEKALRDTVIQAVSGIKSCVASTEKVPNPDDPKNPKELDVIFTEGVNLPAMLEYQDVINPHLLYTNSIHHTLRFYGVEAARANAIKEMAAVFEGHSISVNNRHLNLIGDFMTRSGGFKGFNRLSLTSNTSPFMKMSFETTVGFLKEAVAQGESDELRNPSARIVVGRLGKMGTGMVDVLVPINNGEQNEELGSGLAGHDDDEEMVNGL